MNILKDLFHMTTFGVFEDDKPIRQKAVPNECRSAERELYFQLGRLKEATEQLNKALKDKQ